MVRLNTRKGAVVVVILWLLVFTSAGLGVQAASFPINVSNSAQDSRAPAVAVTREGTIHVVWEEEGGLYHRWFDGNAWSTPQRISVGGAHPVLWVDRVRDGIVYLVWDEPFGTGRDVFIRRWTGNAWSLPRNISQSAGYAGQPDIAQYADGTLVVVWSDTSPGRPTLYRAISNDGIVWTAVTPLSQMVGMNPQVEIVDGQEHLIWLYRASFRSPRQLLWSYWNGDQWEAPEVISTPDRSVDGAAALSVGKGLWVAWNEVGDISARIWRKSTGWSDPQVVSVTGSGRPGLGQLGRQTWLIWPENGTLQRSIWLDGWTPAERYWTGGADVSGLVMANTLQYLAVAWSQQGDEAWDIWVNVEEIFWQRIPYVQVR